MSPNFQDGLHDLLPLFYGWGGRILSGYDQFSQVEGHPPADGVVIFKVSREHAPKFEDSVSIRASVLADR
jgi:hypothetical protein